MELVSSAVHSMHTFHLRCRMKRESIIQNMRGIELKCNMYTWTVTSEPMLLTVTVFWSIWIIIAIWYCRWQNCDENCISVKIIGSVRTAGLYLCNRQIYSYWPLLIEHHSQSGSVLPNLCRYLPVPAIIS